MGNIVEQTIETDVNEYGYQKFTHKIVTKALPIQHIIIKGPTVSNYDLTITDLEPATCREYLVNFGPTLQREKVDSSAKTGSFLVKTTPIGATLTIKEEPYFKQTTPFTIKDHSAGKLNIKLEKSNYLPVDTAITIIPDKLLETNVVLKLEHDPTINIQSEIKRHSRNQCIWLASTVLSAGTGAYFLLAANKTYKEYQESNDSHAADLYDAAVLYDKIKVACFGLAGFCAIEFTIQTVKKNRDKNQLKVLVSGQDAKLSFTF